MVGQIFFGMMAVIGLFAALRPELFTRCFLDKHRRELLGTNFKPIAYTGWGIFGISVAVVVAMSLGNKLRPHAPMLEALVFLSFAVAYVWWGTSLVLRPDSFLRRATAPYSRLPRWVVIAVGLLLLLAAIAFLYAFATRVNVLP